MAVKLLHEELMQDEELVARARDEARLMSQLNHDHVVKVHALTRLSGRSAVLMEYVEGIDCTALLADCRRRGEPGLPLPIAVAITERAASALHAAWTSISPQTGRPLCVVHRDIKPSNLLVSVSGAVKVMDFGVARAEFDREASTQSVQYGTQRYMAPERWLESKAGPESDVYSLGVTLWELAAGTRFERLPLSQVHYDGKRGEQLAELGRHTPADPRALGVLQSLLARMLAFEPRDRPSAAEVEELCGSLLDSVRGPDLRRWARRIVPPLVSARAGELRDDADLQALSGTLSQHVTPQETAATPPRVEPTWNDSPSLGDSEGLAEGPSKLPVIVAMAVALIAVLGFGGVAAWNMVPADETVTDEVVDHEMDEAADEEPAVEVVAEEPVEPAPAARAPRRVQPETPVAEVVEPIAEPVAEPIGEPVIKVVERPADEPEITWIKITADPRDGVVTRDGVSIPSFQNVQYEVGATVRLTFTWPDAQSVTCEKQITSDIAKIKFDKEKRACTYS